MQLRHDSPIGAERVSVDGVAQDEKSIALVDDRGCIGWSLGCGRLRNDGGWRSI